MKTKRIAGLLATLVFAFAVAACSSDSATPAPTEAAPVATEAAG